MNIKAIVPSGNFQSDKPTTAIEIEVKKQNRDKLLWFLEDFVREYAEETPEIKKSSNTIFQMWNKWCEETKIRVEYNKIQFGIKFTQIVKKKFTQKDKSYIKRDQNNQITTFYIPELKEYFKELNKNDFIDEDE
jgi:phage/plasmid-associated DNA primase